MMILSNNEKVIQFSLNEIIRENKNVGDIIRYTYTPELPTITCSSKKDAEYIQKEVNAFVNKIVNSLIK